MRKLLISFSGGRTSAFMCWWLLNVWEDRKAFQIIVVFANTGKEVEGTLLFVDECAQEWGIDIVWVEYTTTGHKVVTYETASRKGEPFEALIAKEGIPSSATPFCSNRLKNRTIKSYARSIRWKKYWVAIGIRNDEKKRMNKKWRSERIFYPLIDRIPTSKEDVNQFWKSQSFDLNIDGDEGNCDGCWKKNILTLCRIAIKNPKVFKWWQDMTDQYGYFNPRGTAEPPFNFYRGRLSPKDIFVLSALPVDQIYAMAKREKLDGCSTSCEAF